MCAKKYTEYAFIPAGYYKPAGTLGKHHCTVVLQDEKKVVVGSIAGRVTLKSGDTLGYDCGTIWLLPSPKSYSDPIRRVLAEARISQKMLEYSDDPVKSASGEFINALGEYSVQHADDYKSATIYGGQVVLSQYDRNDGNFLEPNRSIRSSRIVVRKKANKQDVSDWLYMKFLGGREDERCEKGRQLEARLYINMQAKKYSIEPLRNGEEDAVILFIELKKKIKPYVGGNPEVGDGWYAFMGYTEPGDSSRFDIRPDAIEFHGNWDGIKFTKNVPFLEWYRNIR